MTQFLETNQRSKANPEDYPNGRLLSSRLGIIRGFAGRSLTTRVGCRQDLNPRRQWWRVAEGVVDGWSPVTDAYDPWNKPSRKPLGYAFRAVLA